MVMLTRHTRNWIVEIISYLFVLLFVYAAVSKLLDFDTFRNQLGQSPLLSAYAGWIVWMVPTVEILIAIGLMIPRFRKIALSAFFVTMIMFTTYIIIILNFADFVPCSCGGVLEKLGWTEHLLFNIAFVVLSLFTIFISYDRGFKLKKVIWGLLALFVFGSGTVSLLYLGSERNMKRNNAFVRRYIPHAVEKIGEYDLKYNSYYIAGINDGKVYLGNVTTPLQVLVLDTLLRKTKMLSLKLDNMTLPYKAVNVMIGASDFFVSDGTVPIILHGSKSDWYAKTFSRDIFFTAATQLDSDNIGIRIANGNTLKNSIGVLSISNINEKDIPMYELPAKSDGIFESDGQLLWNSQLKKMIYTYFYSNRYFLLSPSLQKIEERHTIDTVTSPVLEVFHYEASGQDKLQSNTSLINSYAATYGEYLFIKSNRLGRFEPQEMLNEASIIDVYELPENQYAFSFYIYANDGKKLTSFHVENKSLYALMKDKLVKYQMKDILYQDF